MSKNKEYRICARVSANVKFALDRECFEQMESITTIISRALLMYHSYKQQKREGQSEIRITENTDD